ncbi:MAG: HI1506-related protein, partial [Syntrophobacteraceae bacterium]
GFRRCGVAHRKEWSEYPGDHFTAEEIEILCSEPMLQVEMIEEDELREKCKSPEKAEAGVKE